MNFEIKKENFPALTGIRAIAAYMVFLNHFVCYYPNVFSKFWFGYFFEFYFGVTMFFVLSGFLITYIYYDLEKFNFRNFIQKRFARIYPMYFILTTICFIYLTFYERQSWKVYLLNITFLRTFFKEFHITGIGTGWSLTVEEMFYFMAPIFFLLIRKSKIYLLIIPTLLFVFGLIIVHFFGKFNFYGFMVNMPFMYQFTLFGRISEFMIGIGLALFYQKCKDSFKTKYVTYFGIFMIFLGVYFLSLVKGKNFEGIDSNFGRILNSILIPFFGVVPLYWGLITEKTFISKILSTKSFQILGKSSYVFYLIHVSFILTILNTISKNHIFIFITLNLISILLYRFVEKPLNDYFRSFSISKSPVPEP